MKIERERERERLYEQKSGYTQAEKSQRVRESESAVRDGSPVRRIGGKTRGEHEAGTNVPARDIDSEKERERDKLKAKCAFWCVRRFHTRRDGHVRVCEEAYPP